jgi:hypothetical protein
MINFKDKDESGPAGLMVLAILILLGSLLYMLLVPKPTVARMTTGKQRSKQQILDETKKARERGTAVSSENQPHLWEGEPDRIAASVLAGLTQSAEQHQVKIAAFRPQRTQPQGEIIALPFTLQATGKAAQVHDFLVALDAASSKIALQSLQFSATDVSTSQINANINFTAYTLTTQKATTAIKGER